MSLWSIPASSPNYFDIRDYIGLGYTPVWYRRSTIQIAANEIYNRLTPRLGYDVNSWRNRRYFRGYLYTSNIGQGYTGTTYPENLSYSNGLPLYGSGVETGNYNLDYYSFIRVFGQPLTLYAFYYWSYYSGGGGGVYSYSPNINIYYYDWPISNYQIWANFRYVGGGGRPPIQR